MASETAASTILMLTNDRQIDRRILLQADSLQEDGWEVKILAMPTDSPSRVEDPRVIRIGSQNEHALRRENLVLSLYRAVRRHLSMNSWLMRQLKGLAWRFVVDQERFYLRLFLEESLRHPANVVVAHDLPMLAVGRQAAQAFGARLVYDSHELYCEQEFPRWQQRTWAEIESRHIHACDQVITVNPSIASELTRRYGVAEISVIHNAERMPTEPLKSDYFHQRFKLPARARVLLYQGGLSAGRNIEALVDAMARMSAKDIHLVLLGDGQLSEHLTKRITLLGLGQCVHLHPGVAQEDLLRLTASADAGIIPYQATCLNNYYCTPNKLFEFIAAGLPILASDLPELRRLVEQNEIGLVRDLSSPRATAEAISEFFGDELEMEQRRQRLNVVQKSVSWQQEGEHLKRIYRKLK
jgi:glycosyltransferase involved in cell wall biosynthesis